MQLPRELLLCVLALALVPRHARVWANTEIVNFATSPRPAIDALSGLLPQSEAWPELSPENAERLVHVSPAPLGTPPADVCAARQGGTGARSVVWPNPGGCPHEVWLALGLDDARWAAHASFTLRVSWPASMPADFYIDLYEPAALVRLVHAPNASLPTPTSSSSAQAHAGQAQTRQQYARIRVVSTGVRPAPASPLDALSGEHVSFVVTLEPLLFGVLPMSLLPTVGLISVVALLAAVFVFPRVHGRLAALAERVRAQSAAEGDRKRE
ncbi:hypothetical protein C8Q80DRAFT_15231 [Daedaleopsis nitida]|nr:hypothetical protein C8Q80DRAFT_15231 [Daedaleopsis nitida]